MQRNASSLILTIIKYMLKAIATINNQPLNNQSLLYETDFYAWTQTQVELMKHGNLNALDIANLMEEIQSLGKQQKQELRNRLVQGG